MVTDVFDETRDGDGRLTAMEAEPATGEHDALAAAAGLTLVREVLQVRCPLPAADPAPLALRAFRPGVDDEAWLDVNNRAFEGTPTRAGGPDDRSGPPRPSRGSTPRASSSTDDDGRLAGFCWTKVHPATADDPALGEIYVIGVDPDFHGLGLGRALTLAGLGHLSDRRAAPRACSTSRPPTTSPVALYADSASCPTHPPVVGPGRRR